MPWVFWKPSVQPHAWSPQENLYRWETYKFGECEKALWQCPPLLIPREFRSEDDIFLMPCETVLQTVCTPHWTSESPTGKKPQQLWKKPLNITVTLLPIREAIQVIICVFALNMAKALSEEPSWVCNPPFPQKKKIWWRTLWILWMRKLLSMISSCNQGTCISERPYK